MWDSIGQLEQLVERLETNRQTRITTGIVQQEFDLYAHQGGEEKGEEREGRGEEKREERRGEGGERRGRGKRRGGGEREGRRRELDYKTTFYHSLPGMRKEILSFLYLGGNFALKSVIKRAILRSSYTIFWVK